MIACFIPISAATKPMLLLASINDIDEEIFFIFIRVQILNDILWSAANWFNLSISLPTKVSFTFESLTQIFAQCFDMAEVAPMITILRLFIYFSLNSSFRIFSERNLNLFRGLDRIKIH